MVATTIMRVRGKPFLLKIILVISSLVGGAESATGKQLAFMNRPSTTGRNATTNMATNNNSKATSLSATTPRSSRDEIDPRKEISIVKSISVPFSSDKAFMAFSDLPRQADFSPWLRKVEYINPPPPGVESAGKDWGETRWYMGFRGLSFSWNSICTTLERPGCIEWESTSGMKNFGKVVFEEQLDKDETNVTLTMTFVAPRVVAALFRRSSALGNFVQNRMILSTLKNFRDQVLEEESETVEA